MGKKKRPFLFILRPMKHRLGDAGKSLERISATETVTKADSRLNQKA